MDHPREDQEDKSKGGLESPTARAIIEEMGPRKPRDTQRFLDLFIQSFVEKQRNRAEVQSLADLRRVEASMLAQNQASAQASQLASKLTLEQPPKMHFDLNKEMDPQWDRNERYAESNIPDMQPRGSPSAANEASIEAHVTGTSAEHGQKTEGQLPEEILEEALNPEPATTEEAEMDKMFEENMYPTMEEISGAPAPQEGMEFDSKDDAFFFFAVYARRMGFAIKRDSSYTSRVTNTIQRQAFSCNRGRDEVYKDSALKQRRTCRVVQTKCPVKIYVKEERGKWKITMARLDHNHALAPSQWIVRFMRCHGSMSTSDKLLIQILQETRVPPRNIMKIFRKQRGSFRGVPFDAKYLGNQQYKEKAKLKNKDIEELLKLIKEAKKERPGFFHSFDVDEKDNTVKSIFWTDQLGKANYSQFGHFISFDTTFSTNQYGMPFAPIIGVDNYGKTVIFGAGLLHDESIGSFKWLLKEFVEEMGNNHPHTIITDQDAAITTAISEALPFTIHRFCNFHIGKNIKQNLMPLFLTRPTFHDELRGVVRNSFTPEEFETGWHELLQKHNAEDEPYLQRLFEIREQWVPAYFMDKFFPFTSSTGRSESTNSLFKSYVKRKDSISTFFKEYMIIQEKKQADIDRLRLKTEFKESGNWSYNPLEREAMKIYTDPIYGKFAEELKKTTAYKVEIVEAGKRFKVERVVGYPNSEFPRRIYMVDVSADGSVYTCSCMKMFRDGIQCCHVLKVASQNDIFELPASFVHPRWTTAAGHEIARLTEKRSPTSHDTTHLAVRHAIEMSKVSHILSAVCTDDASYDLFAKGVEELKKVIINDTKRRMQIEAGVVHKRRRVDDPIPKKTNVAQEGSRSDSFNADLNMPPPDDNEIPSTQDVEGEQAFSYKDPAPSGNPGFNLGQRPMSYYEKNSRRLKKLKAQRLCGLCRLPGHKRPQCPDRTKVGLQALQDLQGLQGQQ